jgi:hypothetical protein
MIIVIARTLWTLPTTLVGLTIGTACLPFGARWQFHSGVIEIHGGGVAWLLKNATLLKGGARAITFGDVVLGTTQDALDLTREHERVHVRQAHKWGGLFIPAYLTASFIALLQRRHFYQDNVFEREAYAVSDARRPAGP